MNQQGTFGKLSGIGSCSDFRRASTVRREVRMVKGLFTMTDGRAGRHFRVTSSFAGLLLVVALSACESDERKLERLQEEGALARLRVWAWEQRAAEGTGSSDSLRAAERRLLMHEREMNRFMRGR